VILKGKTGGVIFFWRISVITLAWFDLQTTVDQIRYGNIRGGKACF